MHSMPPNTHPSVPTNLYFRSTHKYTQSAWKVDRRVSQVIIKDVQSTACNVTFTYLPRLYIGPSVKQNTCRRKPNTHFIIDHKIPFQSQQRQATGRRLCAASLSPSLPLFFYVTRTSLFVYTYICPPVYVKCAAKTLLFLLMRFCS